MVLFHRVMHLCSPRGMWTVSVTLKEVRGDRISGIIGIASLSKGLRASATPCPSGHEMNSVREVV